MQALEGVVRIEPDPNSAVIATVPAGTPLTVVAETRWWYTIELAASLASTPTSRIGFVSTGDAHWHTSCELLTPAQLEPGDVFKDCALAPQMIVLPAGSFMIGRRIRIRGRPAMRGRSAR